MTASTEGSTAGRTRQTRAPDFFIVGHPKCGTTALYEMLRVHPQIYMPDLKEPWFLASDMRPRFQPPRSAPPLQTLEEYFALFREAAPQQRAGEASSSYLLSHTAAGEIAELCPDARIIAILREPASFLASLHNQLLRTHVETEKDLKRAIELDMPRREGKKVPRRSHRPQLLRYSDHVRYVEQLQRYRAALPAEQMLVLIYDDFRRDNEGTVRSVLRFLDVDDGTRDLRHWTRTRRVNACALSLIDEVVNMVSVGRGLPARAAKAGIKTLTTDQLRSTALRVTRRRVIHGEPEPADEKLARELRARFKDEVVALSEYLDRDLVSSGAMTTVADAPVSDRRPRSACLAHWRETMAQRQAAAMPAGTVDGVVLRVAWQRRTGRHLHELVAAVERGGQQSFCISRRGGARGTLPAASRPHAWRDRSARSGCRCLKGLRALAHSADFDRDAASRMPPAPSTSSRSTARRRINCARRVAPAIARLRSSRRTRTCGSVIRQHARARRRYPLEGSWTRWLLPRNLKEYAQADRIYVASGYIRDSFLEQGFSDQLMVGLPADADPRFDRAGAAASSDAFEIVYSGSLAVHKGVPLLVEAFRRLPPRTCG